MGHRRLERSRARPREEEGRTSDEEEDTEGVALDSNNLNIETAGMEEDAAERLKAVIEI